MLCSPERNDFTASAEGFHASSSEADRRASGSATRLVDTFPDVCTEGWYSSAYGPCDCSCCFAVRSLRSSRSPLSLCLADVFFLCLADVFVLRHIHRLCRLKTVVWHEVIMSPHILRGQSEI
jgi:hypothetical protein